MLNLADSWKLMADRIFGSRSDYLRKFDYSGFDEIYQKICDLKKEASKSSKPDLSLETSKESQKGSTTPKITEETKTAPKERRKSVEEPIIWKRRKTGESEEISVPVEKPSKDEITPKIYEIIDKSGYFKYDTEIYWICCFPSGPNQSFVGCDICNDWFHFEWVGLQKDLNLENYTCPIWIQLGATDVSENTKGTRRFVTEGEFLKVLEEADGFPIIFSEKQLLKSVYGRVEVWRIEARWVWFWGLFGFWFRREIERGINFPEIQAHFQNLVWKSEDKPEIVSYKRDQKLLKMCQESEIFPFVVEEKEKLVSLLKEIQYAKKVFDSTPR